MPNKKWKNIGELYKSSNGGLTLENIVKRVKEDPIYKTIPINPPPLAKERMTKPFLQGVRKKKKGE